jgi:hypothetical protein
MLIKRYEKCIKNTLVYTAEFEITNPLSGQNGSCSGAYGLSSLASFGDTKLILVILWMDTLIQTDVLLNI